MMLSTTKKLKYFSHATKNIETQLNPDLNISFNQKCINYLSSELLLI